MLNNKVILITGGTGSFGQAFTKTILDKYKKIKKLIIFSRDEFKQFELKKIFPEKKYPCMRYFLGDVRDLNRLNLAFKDVDYVIHAAALKQVDTAEYNPFEFINTNIMGAQNVIEAALNNKVRKVIALSTDKAAAPINLYGATKLCSDKLFISANNITGKTDILFSVVRYGNVMNSRGSVIPLFKQSKEKGYFNITDKRMTRFNITLNEGVGLVLYALKNSIGSEIFVPKLKSYNILDVAKSISAKAKINYIGIREGEKISEEMITVSDSYNTIEAKKFYIILPTKIPNKSRYLKKFKAKKITEPFSYNSSDNPEKLTISDLKKIMKFQ